MSGFPDHVGFLGANTNMQKSQQTATLHPKTDRITVDEGGCKVQRLFRPLPDRAAVQSHAWQPFNAHLQHHGSQAAARLTEIPPARASRRELGQLAVG
jgi:hypothetical protein